MHRGTLLASLAIGLLVAAVATWMIMSPLIVSSYDATLRNARSGQTVTCSVRAEEREHPRYAFALCLTTCRAHGFEAIGPVDNGDFIEFFGSPDDIDSIWAARVRRYAAFIPAACQGNPRKMREHIDAPEG